MRTSRIDVMQVKGGVYILCASGVDMVQVNEEEYSDYNQLSLYVYYLRRKKV